MILRLFEIAVMLFLSVFLVSQIIIPGFYPRLRFFWIFRKIYWEKMDAENEKMTVMEQREIQKIREDFGQVTKPITKGSLHEWPDSRWSCRSNSSDCAVSVHKSTDRKR